MQEYERAVIFRLGRVARGGAKGPGTWKMLLSFARNSMTLVMVKRLIACLMQLK